MLSNENFFNETSSFYDDMIDYQKAIDNKEKVLKNFVTNEMKTAADIGCGTGVDSIVLTKLGLKVTAFDISDMMIETAKKNSKNFNTDINFIKSSASEIPVEFKVKFDFVVSLGNTFANISNKEIKNAFKNIFDILKENGSALLQIINFQKVINENKKIVNITENNDQIFVRFYDFHTSHINFNILRFDKNDLSERKIITTKLYPYLKEKLESVIEETGFENCEFYGSLDRQDYKPDRSNNLIIFLKK